MFMVTQILLFIFELLPDAESKAYLIISILQIWG